MVSYTELVVNLEGSACGDSGGDHRRQRDKPVPHPCGVGVRGLGNKRAQNLSTDYFAPNGNMDPNGHNRTQ